MVHHRLSLQNPRCAQKRRLMEWTTCTPWSLHERHQITCKRSVMSQVLDFREERISLIWDLGIFVWVLKKEYKHCRYRHFIILIGREYSRRADFSALSSLYESINLLHEKPLHEQARSGFNVCLEAEHFFSIVNMSYRVNTPEKCMSRHIEVVWHIKPSWARYGQGL